MVLNEFMVQVRWVNGLNPFEILIQQNEIVVKKEKKKDQTKCYISMNVAFELDFVICNFYSKIFYLCIHQGHLNWIPQSLRDQ